jgi:hypothetical protein
MMGSFVIAAWTKVLIWAVASVIRILNLKLLVDRPSGNATAYDFMILVRMGSATPG